MNDRMDDNFNPDELLHLANAFGHPSQVVECSATSRSTAPSPHDMTNSSIASSGCYILQLRATGLNLSTQPRASCKVPAAARMIDVNATKPCTTTLR